MPIKVISPKKNKEVEEFSKLCEDTMKKQPTGNILEFISDKRNGQSAKIMQWAAVTTFAFIANQMMYEWKFEDVSKEDVEKALETMAKIVKRLQVLI